MFVRNLSRNCSPQKKLHISVCLCFFFHFCRKEKWKKRSPSTELEEERGEKGGWRKMLRRQGPLGLRCSFFPLRGVRAYWCKMALCLSETPASWMELSWSNALWDRSVKRFFFLFLPPNHQPWFSSAFCFLLLPYLNFNLTLSGHGIHVCIFTL